MITENVMFGNPWHGKLAAGSIELVPGTPVTSITLDGVEFSVQSVTGILGDTRYHMAPADRPVPETPAMITAQNGKFERDFIIYSESMRYTPLHDVSIFPGNGFLLWDTTATRWRQMLCGLSGSALTGYTSRPPEGTNVATWNFTRFDQVFGEFGRDEVTPTSTVIDSGYIGYTYKWDPFFQPVVPQAWDWKIACSLSFDASRDGKQVLVSVIGYPEGSYPTPVAGTQRIAAIHKFTLDDTGENILTGPTEMLPTRAQSTIVWDGVHDGDPYLIEWTDGAPAGYKYYDYVQPVSATFEGHWENSISRRILAAHDATGTAKIMYLRDVRNYDISGGYSGGISLGFGYSGLVTIGTVLPPPPAEDPDFPVGPLSYDYTGSLAEQWFGDPGAYTTGYPYVINMRTMVMDDGRVNDKALRVIDELGNVLHEWTDADMLLDFPVPVGWKRLTNNVVSLEYGGESIARVGPGAIDATVMDLPVYASFNPRTGAVVSSDSPIGFV